MNLIGDDIIANRYVKNLLKRENIHKELRLIKEYSYTDYITPDGEVYKYYKDYDGYYKKKCIIHSENGYVYCAITNKKGKNVNKRVHKLVALEYIDNPNPEKLKIVGHKDNIKHHNFKENLYWTTTQENTQKAADDGLLKNETGIDNDMSSPLKVVDLQNNLIAVYGSMRECERYIENIDIGYLNKMLPKNGNYKPRGKKYKYIPITKKEYNNISNDYKYLKLEENLKQTKIPSVFKAINLLTNEEFISDNQKQFAKEHNLEQASISHAIKTGIMYNNWKFELIKKIKYTDGSGYKKLISNITNVILENIKSHEKLTFNNPKEAKDYLGLKGHDFRQYFKREQLILGEWKILQC